MKKISIVLMTLFLIIFLLGFFIGYYLERSGIYYTESRINSLKETIASLKTEMDNLQIQSLYISLLGEKSCGFLVSSSDQIEKELTYFWDRLPNRLEEFEKSDQVSQDYIQLKKDYTFVVLRSWLVSLSLKEKCDKEIIPALYFYSRECDRCVDQGKVLDQLKRENPEFSAFIIDFNLDEPVVKALRDVYNITTVPSFVIDNKAYQGFKTLNELKAIISVVK